MWSQVRVVIVRDPPPPSTLTLDPCTPTTHSPPPRLGTPYPRTLPPRPYVTTVLRSQNNTSTSLTRDHTEKFPHITWTGSFPYFPNTKCACSSCRILVWWSNVVLALWGVCDVRYSVKCDDWWRAWRHRATWFHVALAGTGREDDFDTVTLMYVCCFATKGLFCCCCWVTCISGLRVL